MHFFPWIRLVYTKHPADFLPQEVTFYYPQHPLVLKHSFIKPMNNSQPNLHYHNNQVSTSFICQSTNNKFVTCRISKIKINVNQTIKQLMDTPTSRLPAAVSLPAVPSIFLYSCRCWVSSSLLRFSIRVSSFWTICYTVCKQLLTHTQQTSSCAPLQGAVTWQRWLDDLRGTAHPFW